jgi:hypothetical protein
LTKKVNWVLDLDIRGFFDALSHEWLVKFVEHRIADRRVVRLIQKWLNAGVLEDGKRTRAEEGTPQGGSASPLLANVYLHYVFDLWAQAWRQKQACGDVIIVRFADDIVVGFEVKADAVRFGRNWARECDSSAWNCIPRKRDCWSSDRSRPETGRNAETGNRRRSTSSALRPSAGRRGAMDGSRCCDRRFANGCKRS